MAYSVFISYRRDGGEGFAQIFSEKLAQNRFRVFYDIEAIGVGLFDEKILTEIEESDVFVLILSRGALDRCINEEDWVRREIAHALKLNKPIIPLFFRGFEFPDSLPAEIEKLPYYNGIDIRDLNFLDAKVKQLCTMINEAAKKSFTPTPKPKAPERIITPTVSEAAPTPTYASGTVTSEATRRLEKAESYYKKAMKTNKSTPWLFNTTIFKYKCDYFTTLAAELGHTEALKRMLTGAYTEGRYSSKDVFHSKRIHNAIKAENPRAKLLYTLQNYDRGNYRVDYLASNVNAIATQGYLPAQIMMGDFYSPGISKIHTLIGLRVSLTDQNIALYWYSKAAEKQTPYAYRRIGALYEEGNISQQNPAQAVLNYRRGAELGDPECQYRLARCAKLGRGMNRDIEQAKYWYGKAADNGCQDAQSELMSLIGR